MDDHHHSSSETDTHCRILRAALAELTQGGYKGTSTRTIAERAGVNEVTVFRHFGSKQAMFQAAILHALQDLHVPDTLDDYLELSFREGLGKFAQDYLLQISRNSDVIMLGLAESYSHPLIIEELQKFWSRVRRSSIQYFEHLHEQGRMREADYLVLTQMVLTTLHSTPMIRKRAGDDVIRQLSDERLVAAIVDTIAKAYSLEE